MRAPSSLALLGLIACGSPEPTGGTTPTTGLSVEEPRIDRVDPDFGTNAGGDLVTLLGGPFPDGAEVFVGGEPAEVTDLTPDRIQLLTPPNEKTDWVPIKVVGPDGEEIKQPKSFQYWADGRDLTGLWGEGYRLDYLGSYWTNQGGGTGPYTPPPQAQVRMAWMNPAEFTYADIWAPYNDWCEVDYSPFLQATLIDTGMESFTLSGDDGESIRLLPSATDAGYFDALDLQANLLAPGTVYSLDPGGANGIWPAFGVDELITVPERPEILTPPMNDAVPPSVTDPIELEWTPSADSSYMIAIVSRTSAGGAVIEERATCLLTDDGQHTIDPLTWSDWIPGEFVLIQLGRVIAEERVLPHNRTDSQLVGVYWVYGAAQAI